MGRMPVAPLILNKTTKMKTKKVTISLTQEQQDKAKKDSIEVFGKENLSGYIQVLIQNGFKKTNVRGQKIK
jgi:hypothetical protein